MSFKKEAALTKNELTRGFLHAIAKTNRTGMQILPQSIWEYLGNPPKKLVNVAAAQQGYEILKTEDVVKELVEQATDSQNPINAQACKYIFFNNDGKMQNRCLLPKH